MSENEQRQLSIAEAAGYLHVTPMTVWKYVKRGLLASTRITGYRSRPEHRIALSDLEAFELPRRGAKPKARATKVFKRDTGRIVWDGIRYDSLAALAEVKGVSRERVRQWKRAGYTGDADIQTKYHNGKGRKK